MIYLLFAFLVFALGLFIYCGWVEPRAFQTNRYTVQLKKQLSTSLKILHLSDTHFADPCKARKRFFERLAKEDYDFVFLTGDIIDAPSGIPICIEHLKLFSPKYGIYAVYGNHDYYEYKLVDAVFNNFATKGVHPARLQPIERFHRDLVTMGVKVLKNQTEKVEIDGQEVLVHGLDDPTTGHDDPSQLQPNMDRGKVNILLTHLVDSVSNFEKGHVDISFSGHSHGGQIKFPVVGALVCHTQMGQRFISGVQEYQGTQCVISRGVAASRRFFFRLLAPTEAIVITLQGSAS